jgi:hypothetical protein
MAQTNSMAMFQSHSPANSNDNLLRFPSFPIEGFPLQIQAIPHCTLHRISSQFITERTAKEMYALVHADRAHLEPWLPWVTEVQRWQDQQRFLRQSLALYYRDHEAHR